MWVRVTDEGDWIYEGEAHGPDSLRAVVLAAMRVWRVGGRMHPDMVLRGRLAEIERWIEERRGREGATDEARRSWEAQARHWRFQAEAKRGWAMGEGLRVHVYAEASGQWLTPTNRLPAPSIKAVCLRPAEIWDSAVRTIEHDRNISAIASIAAGEACAPRRRAFRIIDGGRGGR